MKKKIALYLIGLTLLIGSCDKAERQTYLIPDNYTGRVTIFFNQNGKPFRYKNEYGHDTVYISQIGDPIKYENGRRIYQIPRNGVLLTQFKQTSGFTDDQYYSVDSKGKRTQLTVFALDNHKRDSIRWQVGDKNKKGIFWDGTNGSYGNMNVPYQFFIVSSSEQLYDIYNQKAQNSFNNIIEKVTDFLGFRSPY